MGAISSIFQYPQAGSNLCNLVQLLRVGSNSFFQYPQAGSNLCNPLALDTSDATRGLSVPSSRVEPLQPPVSKTFQTSFDTFQPGKAFC